VSLELVGESPGSKQGGIVQLVSREVQLEALPTGIPEHVELDISALEIGVTLRIEDLVPIEGVTFLDDPQMVLATCTIPRGLTELEEGVAEGEDEEGAEGAEGEAAEASDEGAPAAED
jgi:large subunit ribosomal protein L25